MTDPTQIGMHQKLFTDYLTAAVKEVGTPALMNPQTLEEVAALAFEFSNRCVIHYDAIATAYRQQSEAASQRAQAEVEAERTRATAGVRATAQRIQTDRLDALLARGRTNGWYEGDEVARKAWQSELDALMPPKAAGIAPIPPHVTATVRPAPAPAPAPAPEGLRAAKGGAK